MTQPELPFNGFPPYIKGSDTSLAAAESVEPSTGTMRARVLDYLRWLTRQHFTDISQWGATDEEICGALEMPGNTVRPRRVELVERGLVEKTEHRRKTRSGRFATVWRAK